MIDLVLQRLETLQSELARLDPAREVDAAAQVAAMVSALRDVVAESKMSRRKAALTTKDRPIRAAAG